MQNVKLTAYRRPQPESSFTIKKYYYSVFTYNAEFYFKSERRLKLWLGKLNRELNATAHELNFTYAEVFSEYRYYYMHYGTKERQEFQRKFSAIDKSFEYLTTRCNNRTSNDNAYHHINYIVSELTIVVELLQQNSMNTLATIQRTRLKNLLLRVSRIKTSVETVPEGYDKRKDYSR